MIFRLREYAPSATTAFCLIIAVIAANPSWNYWYFRARNLNVVFQYSVGYAALACSLLVALVVADWPAAIAFALYVAYLPYALALFYRTWQLNR